MSLSSLSSAAGCCRIHRRLDVDEYSFEEYSDSVSVASSVGILVDTGRKRHQTETHGGWKE